jgi:hypothetical protein
MVSASGATSLAWQSGMAKGVRRSVRRHSCGLRSEHRIPSPQFDAGVRTYETRRVGEEKKCARSSCCPQLADLSWAFFPRLRRCISVVQERHLNLAVHSAGLACCDLAWWHLGVDGHRLGHRSRARGWPCCQFVSANALIPSTQTASATRIVPTFISG